MNERNNKRKVEWMFNHLCTKCTIRKKYTGYKRSAHVASKKKRKFSFSCSCKIQHTRWRWWFQHVHIAYYVFVRIYMNIRIYQRATSEKYFSFSRHFFPPLDRNLLLFFFFFFSLSLSLALKLPGFREASRWNILFIVQKLLF